jgi:hypothetical protein
LGYFAVKFAPLACVKVVSQHPLWRVFGQSHQRECARTVNGDWPLLANERVPHLWFFRVYTEIGNKTRYQAGQQHIVERVTVPQFLLHLIALIFQLLQLESISSDNALDNLQDLELQFFDLLQSFFAQKKFLYPKT